MTYRPIRTSVKAQKLDKETWVSPLRTEYVSRVVGRGEYLTAPMFFGRAYEGPPRFDWYSTIVESYGENIETDFPIAPDMTVGVAEWIKDSLGAYVGARVWIKIPCSEESLATCVHPPFRVGPNILADGGFELANGFGPLGNELPGQGDVGGQVFPYLNWSDLTFPATLSPGKWYQDDSDGGGGRAWRVSSVNPHSGNFHLRQTRVTATGFNGNVLNVVTFLVCPEASPSYRTTGNLSNWNVGAAAVVVPGAHWELDFQAMVSRASAVAASVGFAVDVMYSDAEDSDISSERVLAQVAGLSYSDFHAAQVVPDATFLGFEPHLMFLRIVNTNGGNWGDVSGEGLFIDLDSVSLGMSA